MVFLAMMATSLNMIQEHFRSRGATGVSRTTGIHSSPVADAEQVMMKSNTGSTQSMHHFDTEHLT